MVNVSHSQVCLGSVRVWVLACVCDMFMLCVCVCGFA